MPNENVFPLFSDWQLEHIQEAIGERFRGPNVDLRGRVANEILRSARRPNPELIEYPACGRLALFRNPGDAAAIWYVPDTGSDARTPRLRELFADD